MTVMFHTDGTVFAEGKGRLVLCVDPRCEYVMEHFLASDTETEKQSAGQEDSADGFDKNSSLCYNQEI